jgi:hypothetical protein
MVMRRQSNPTSPSTGNSTPCSASTPSYTSATPGGLVGSFSPLQQRHLRRFSGFGAPSSPTPLTPSTRPNAEAHGGPCSISLSPYFPGTLTLPDGASSEPPSTPSNLMTTAALHQRILEQHEVVTPAPNRHFSCTDPLGASISQSPCKTALPLTPMKAKHLLMEKLPGGPGPTSPSDPQLGNHDLRRTAMLRALLQRAEICDGTPGPRGRMAHLATAPPVLSLLSHSHRRAGAAQDASSSLLLLSPLPCDAESFSAPRHDRAAAGCGGGQSLARQMEAAAEEAEAQGRGRDPTQAPQWQLSGASGRDLLFSLRRALPRSAEVCNRWIVVRRRIAGPNLCLFFDMTLTKASRITRWGR